MNLHEAYQRLNSPSTRLRGKRLYTLVLAAILMLVLLFFLLYASVIWLKYSVSAFLGKHRDIDWPSMCQQPHLLIPPSEILGLDDASQFLTQNYRIRSAHLLSHAVQIPTESFDDMDQEPLQDSRFEIFRDFHDFLAEEFPLITTHLEKVNTYGLLYTIKGKSEEKPVVLMAHQDVVPVERHTLNKWTHGAFSGHYDGNTIWGRGSADTKSSLIAILEAVESLLWQEWLPNRTVLLSFGFDEELDGSRGALALADTIRSRYGATHSIFMILDEGSDVSVQQGIPVATIGVCEKGYADISISVKAPGGHSSKPPDHTTIGVLSEILKNLEDNQIERNDYRLPRNGIVADMFACLGRFGEFESSKDRRAFVDSEKLEAMLSTDRSLRTLIGTTQAIDVINGGVKINALPERASAMVNYRINVAESVEAVLNRLRETVENVASSHDYGIMLNKKMLRPDSGRGTIEISNGQSLEPAPVSPYDFDDKQWSIIAGTTKHTLSMWFNISNLVVSPTLMTGNTDTWRYQGLTDHIYRFTNSLPNSGANAHTIDEHISLDGHLATVIWYYETLLFF